MPLFVSPKSHVLPTDTPGKSQRFDDTNHRVTLLPAGHRAAAAVGRTPLPLSERDAGRVPQLTVARQALAFCCATSAGVHLALVPSHWTESRLLAAGFIVAALLLGATATAGVVATSRSWWIATALLLTGLVALYLLSRTTGLPGLTEVESFDPVGVATEVVQLIGLTAALRCTFRRETS
jgi:hypothetical protein